MHQFELIDEAGNAHGPFGSVKELLAYVDDRCLGEPQSEENISQGWYLREHKLEQ